VMTDSRQGKRNSRSHSAGIASKLADVVWNGTLDRMGKGPELKVGIEPDDGLWGGYKYVWPGIAACSLRLKGRKKKKNFSHSLFPDGLDSVSVRTVES